MTASESIPPVLDRIRFSAYSVSVLDVNPPAYVVPGKISKLLDTYGFEGRIEMGPHPLYPDEIQAVLLVRFKGDDPRNSGISVEHDQEMLFHGHRYITLESDDWA